MCYVKKKTGENSVVVQWLGLHASPAGDTGSIPGQGAKITRRVVQLEKQQQQPENCLNF